MFDAQRRLSALHTTARRMPIADSDRIAILSDLHLGNGGTRDDFVGNSTLCLTALRDYYLPRGFHLVLNGDIEELQRFSRARVRAAWREFLNLLDEFRREGGCTRLEGNHDGGPAAEEDTEQAIRLTYGRDTLLVFHGHQATALYERVNPGIGLILRYCATPLSIGNRSVSHSSERRFRIERRVYEYSTRAGIASVIGHTHRPLFESFSKADTLRYRIEALCRRYPEAPAEEQARLAPLIGSLRRELARSLQKHGHETLPSSVYGSCLHVPCLFNSGCCIGKSGITSIEIVRGRIALVRWFDRSRIRALSPGSRGRARPMSGGAVHRVVLKEEDLRYVFARIHLLADQQTTPAPEPIGHVHPVDAREA